MRCCSSVFERSIRELQGVKSLYEPHQTPFYFGPERQQHNNGNYNHLVSTYSLYTYDYADQLLLADYEECSAVFVRDMPYPLQKQHCHIIWQSIFQRRGSLDTLKVNFPTSSTRF